MFGEQKMAHSSITWCCYGQFWVDPRTCEYTHKNKSNNLTRFSITCVCVCLNWNTVIICLKSRNELYKHRQHDNIYILASSTFFQGCQFNGKTTVKCHPSETISHRPWKLQISHEIPYTEILQEIDGIMMSLSLPQIPMTHTYIKDTRTLPPPATDYRSFWTFFTTSGLRRHVTWSWGSPKCWDGWDNMTPAFYKLRSIGPKVRANQKTR